MSTGLRRMPTRWGFTEYSLVAFGIGTLVVTLIITTDERAMENVLNLWQDTQESEVTPFQSSTFVNITILHHAVKKGAVCLDGTPPAYHLQKGHGSGANKWLIHLEGGGWCNNLSSCAFRKRTRLGSSLYMQSQVMFSGILGNNPSENPDFYNWNRVKVRYCDGGSFSGDAEAKYQGESIFFRGQQIWNEVVFDLLAKGMDKAHQAFLSGCSAGALASFIHCDGFRELLPNNVKIKCIGDAGFFLNVKDINGREHIRSFFNDVITTQKIIKNLPRRCTSRMDPTMCFFPEYLLNHVQTPVFVLNPTIDSWQIQNILAPAVADLGRHWLDCKRNIKFCSQSQLKTMQVFSENMLKALEPVKRLKTVGMFLNSCFAHCQTEWQGTWFSPSSPRLNNKTIAEAVGDWYFDRKVAKYIDCPYPCDSTCHHLTE